VILNFPQDGPTSRVGQPHATADTNTYHIVHLRQKDIDDGKVKISTGGDEKSKTQIMPGRYLVDDQGKPHYRTDIPIDQKSKKMDDGTTVRGFSAPQPELFKSIIEGILGGTLEWGLFGIGALIAISLELAGVRALPFAVGMYLPLSLSIPIFIGGLLRWGVDKLRGVGASEAETETSPGVLLASGYIAGGTVCGLIIAFFTFLPYGFNRLIDASHLLGAGNVLQFDKEKIAETTKAVDEARANGETEEAKADKLVQDAQTDEQKQKATREKAERTEEKLKAVDGVFSDFWLESRAAKIIALLAFALLCGFLFWQGLQKPPKEVGTAAQPPLPIGPDTRIQAGP
jgi:hypothetical protein